MTDTANGVPPDFTSFRSAAEMQGDRGKGVAEMMQLQGQGADPATHFRVTDTTNPDGTWVEGWKTMPRVKAPFNPPVTLKEPS